MSFQLHNFRTDQNDTLDRNTIIDQENLWDYFPPMPSELFRSLISALFQHYLDKCDTSYEALISTIRTLRTGEYGPLKERQPTDKPCPPEPMFGILYPN